MKKLFALMILAPAFLLVWTANVLAQEVMCPPFVDSVTVDQVVVGPGLCVILDSTIKNGGLQAQSPGSSLVVINSDVLNGDVQAFGIDFVSVSRSLILNGNVSVRDIEESVTIHDNIITNGNIQVERAGLARSPGVGVSNNLLATGNMQLQSNGGVSVGLNELVVGDLQIFDNVNPGRLVVNVQQNHVHLERRKKRKK